MTTRHAWLPPRGTLLISTDLHGNGEDFRALRARFLQMMQRDPEVHWVVLGDSVHGPDAAARAEHPELYDYPDESGAIVLELLGLRQRYPDSVHYVLGNHDHAHIGGPRTRKFYDDEAEHLEARLSPPERVALRALFSTAKLAVFAPCGALLSHGSPDDTLRAAADLDAIPLELARCDAYQRRVLATFLQSYGQRGEVTARLLQRLSSTGRELTFVVHGHDRDESGWFIEGDNQACPVIFGAPRAHKRLLCLDLAARYRSVHELRDGVEIQRVHG
ncbi:MAG TPA: metallophosphoesterase [Pseudomonadota bacterium]|nr:metallophosphoesterase [Pseudomonadota bacterium]